MRFNRQILRTRNCPGDARWHPVKKCITHWLASFRPEFLRGLIHTGNGFNSGGSLRLQAVDGFGIAVLASSETAVKAISTVAFSAC